MKKFSNFILSAFVNQHGSHAVVRTRSRHFKEGLNEDDSNSNSAEIEGWHDDTPEGRRHLEELKYHYHNGGEKSGFHNLVSPGGTGGFTRGSSYELSKNGHVFGRSDNADNDVRALHAKLRDMHHTDHMQSDHHESLRSYTSTSTTLNHALAHEHPLHSWNIDKVHRLDYSILNSHPSHDKSTVTYHGTGLNIHAHMAGTPIIHSKGFLSSSTESGIAHNFCTNSIGNYNNDPRNVLAIHSPSGHTMLPISPNISRFPEENEVLHPRGMILRPRASITTSKGSFKHSFWHVDIDGIRPHALTQKAYEEE